MNNLNLSRARGGLAVLLAALSATAMSAGTQAPAAPAISGASSAAPAYAGEAGQGYTAYPGSGYSGDPGYAAGYYPTEQGYYPAEQGYAVPGYAPDSAYQADPYAGYSVDPYATYPGGTPYAGYSVDPGATYPATDPYAGYAADPYGGGYAEPYAGGYTGNPYSYNYPSYPSQGMPMMPQGGPGGWGNNTPFFGGDNPVFGGDNPFENPFDNHGYWANKNFQPWSSGPFERDRWTKDHPMSNMPWGNFPGWGDGFFGGFGPDNWKGVTPWGNDVPFKWIDPTDPRESIADIWDDALNTPNALGRMPPGWTAPYISVPNPVEVEEEFERNARKFPDEMRKAINTGDGDFGNGTSSGGKDKAGKKDGKGKGKDGKPKPFIERIKPVGPIYDKKDDRPNPEAKR